MANQVTLQADVGNIPTNSLALLGVAQPLLKALSADNINALAVLQAQALGDQLLSNGDWALKLPDLLARSSSVRLERLSAWVGWQKGDTASFMSRSSGGRTISLLCLALGNLYAKERCGIILHELSTHIIQKEQQNASISQLSDLNACLSDKLSCLGFGNLLALHLTRIRQCFFEAGSQIPVDLADMPTEETMVDFLVALQKALQSEELILSFTGSRGAGPLLALLMCLCPEDTRVEVQGEVIHQGPRVSISFLITGDEHNGSSFYIQSKICAHSDDFRNRFLEIDDTNEHQALNFRWSGWLSARVDIALAKIGAKASREVQEALANLIATAVLSISDEELRGTSGDFRISKKGMRTLLGPDNDSRIRKTLSTVLIEPTDFECCDIVSSYDQFTLAVTLAIPKTTCSCGICAEVEYWDENQHPRAVTTLGKAWQACRIARFWAVLTEIFEMGYASSLLKVESNVALGRSQNIDKPKPEYIGSLAKNVFATVHLRKGDDTSYRYSPAVAASYIHDIILSVVNQWRSTFYSEGQERPPTICQSSGHVTVFPTTLEYPCVTHPWTIEYLLVDGKLHNGPNSYSAIICARPHKGEAKRLKRPKAGTALLSKKATIAPSSLGEHDLLTMTLQPEVVQRKQVLLLQTRIQSSTKSCHVDFLDIHLGYLCLSPADECEHAPNSALDAEYASGVICTSVQTPGARGANVLALALTHWNPESQFLCCSYSSPALYQGSCCLTCAVLQARERKVEMIIGGNN